MRVSGRRPVVDQDILIGRDQGAKLLFPWYGPALVTKILDRELVV